MASGSRRTLYLRERGAGEQARLAALGLWDAGRVRADAHQHLGRALFRALSADPASAQALGTLRDNATFSGRPLALLLRFPAEALELAALPWELLWDDGPAPLLLSRGRLAACTRHLDLPQALPPPRASGGPLRILPIAPQAGIPASVRSAKRAARLAAWQPLIDSGQVVVEPEVMPATRGALVDALQRAAQRDQPPDIIHYYGHGRYAAGEGALLLDGTNDGWEWTSASSLMTLLGDVRLVVLFACQTALVEAGAPGLLTGVAPALNAAGVPLVLAMQLTTRMEAATRASEVIYRAIVAGQSVQEAVSQARQALFVEEGDRASWYVPALYIRSRDTGPAYLLAAPTSQTHARSATRGATQQIIATKKSKVIGAEQYGSSGADQEIRAADASTIERARQRATRSSEQRIRAEDEGEIADALQDDRDELAPDDE